jgi:hypothetical protein
MRLAALVLACIPFAWSADGDASQARLRQSWIAIGSPSQEPTEGQQFEVTVDYSLQDGPPAILTLSGYGPWIDLPDGTYETKRHHIDYPGLNAKAEVLPGAGRQVFRFTVPKLQGGDGVLWVAAFREQDGQRWPWEVRNTTAMHPLPPPLTLSAAVPNNLFTYDEPVAFSLTAAGRAGASITATWKLTALDGTVAGSGEQRLDMPADGSPAPLMIPWQRRGVFGLSVAVDGTSASTTFARIPDVMAITKGEPTAFGLHHLISRATPAEHDRRMRAARRLGLTTCRQFVSWNAIEPARGTWRLDDLDLALSKAAEHGIRPLLCLGNPPAWAMQTRFSAHFEPFAFDEAGWTDAVTTLTRRYKGRIDAWEWLNEIVPGPESDPIGIYLRMCELGTAAAKAEDPQVLTALAGGLWPRSFRQGLLAAGIAKHVDILPIHYGSGDAIREAQGDLAATGAAGVQVWDDETAKGVSTWRMPQAEALQRREQRAWAMTQWPDELSAGAKRIIWFGGSGDAAGNWDIFWGNGSPRPVAATLAVLAAKLHGAHPQGSFRLGGSGPFHLFDVGGRALLVVPAGKGEARLRLGAGPVQMTDDQGEEQTVAATADGTALPLAAMPRFVEGGDLAVLRGYTAPTLLADAVSLLAGDVGQLGLRLVNRGDQPLSATFSSALPEGFPATAPVAVTVAPGATQLVAIPLTIPAGTAPGEHRLHVTCRYADARLPLVELPWSLAVVDPHRLGNLLQNGGFEGGDAKPWSAAKPVAVVPAGEFPQGLGTTVLRLAGSTGWQNASQGLPVTAGRAYLYSAWVHVDNKQAGSNIDQSGGKTLYMPDVFAATNTADWQFLSKVYTPAAGVDHAGFTPVAKGAGEARFDNIRVSVYEGTPYAAEAQRLQTAPDIDGDLGEWAGGEPVPLLGPGQSTILDRDWKPGAANLRGVVKLAWDDRNLYLAAWVDDDVLAAPSTGERTPDSDSLVLALHPGNRAPGEDDRAFALYLSPAEPGGGSGRCTLYRPAAHSAGLSSGQLAKDSSVHELVIRRTGQQTCYEARLPWSELGMTGRLGAKLGCSLQLNDNDGGGRAAFISWGDGLAPAWAPQRFGILTLVGP